MMLFLIDKTSRFAGKILGTFLKGKSFALAYNNRLSPVLPGKAESNSKL